MPVIFSLYNLFIDKANLLQSAVLLVVRLWIAHVFFASGLVKIADFDTTIALFRDEYAVPVLPPVLAAVMATIFELSCPVLLTLGAATRLATLPLIGMTAVIQLTYDQNIQHAYWAMLLFTLLAFGAGKWSIDSIIKRQAKGGRYATA